MYLLSSEYAVFRCGCGETSIPMVEDAKDNRYAVCRYVKPIHKADLCIALCPSLKEAEFIVRMTQKLATIEQAIRET